MRTTKRLSQVTLFYQMSFNGNAVNNALNYCSLRELDRQKLRFCLSVSLIVRIPIHGNTNGDDTTKRGYSAYIVDWLQRTLSREWSMPRLKVGWKSSPKVAHSSSRILVLQITNNAIKFDPCGRRTIVPRAAYSTQDASSSNLGIYEYL